MKTISRYIMTLALLLTAVTGAWAAETKVTIDAAEYDNISTYTSFSKEKDGITIAFSSSRKNNSGFDLQSESTVTITSTVGKIKSVVFYCLAAGTAKYGPGCLGYPTAGQYSYIDMTGTWTGEAESFTLTSTDKVRIEKIDVTVGEADAPTEPDVEVTTGSSANTWTFSMPGSDVVLTPIYAKAAAFATTGTEPDVKTLLPEAAEGVIAGTDASLIAENTGIVAFAGTSTEVTQGTLMYAIGTSATEAPAPAAFSATVPTAKDIADDGATLYVWYYIQGADAPEGEAATLDNTFDNTEPACLTVQVLTNKFDIQFNAANANTIEAGKATVTVGGTAATVTEGKLQGVKMGSEVKVKAATGYKFRKVEVKKKEAEALPALNITNPVVGQVIGSDGKNYAANATMPDGVTKVAMITYVGSETGHDTYKSGLAIALRDEGEMDWATAKSTCEGKSTFTNAAWMVPSVPQWFAMCEATGNDGNSYYGSMKYAMIAAAGEESSFKEDGYQYWSSSEISSSTAYCFGLKDDTTNYANVDKNNIKGVRAVLAF